MMNKKLSKKRREQLFCRYYAVFLDAGEAARRAGYQEPETEGPLLLTQSRIQSQLNELENENRSLLMNQAIEGYRKLAFSSAKDAVRLLDTQRERSETDDLDLFSISEIKTSSSGVQIKFFDRQKALDKLCELAQGIKDTKAAEETLEDNLCEAISKGAKAIAEKDGQAQDA